jgi:hypothetical protein
MTTGLLLKIKAMNINTQQSNKMRKRASKWNKRQLSLRQRISKIMLLNASLVVISFFLGYILSLSTMTLQLV